MQQKMETTEQRERQKKFLLLLPLIILPLLAFVFWKFGGGKADASEQAVQQHGINTELPQAQFKGEKSQDKMGLYDMAAKDSALEKRREAGSIFGSVKADSTAGGKSGVFSNQTTAASEAKINQKLAQIRQQISSAPNPQPYPPQAYAPPPSTDMSTAQVDRLEKMMKAMQGQQSKDPQMKQLSGMMDKIYQIQHPDIVNEKLKKATPVKPDSQFRAIPALIDGNQKVLQGGIVRLRLQDSISLAGIHLPKGFKLYGNCVITNQRLLLTIKNITLGNTIVPVDLTVFSRDGIAGINAPEAELTEAAGNGTNDALSSMEFMPMDETMGTQAASAGINAAKDLIGKKVRKIKVKLKGDYPVLLRNNH